MFKHTLSIVASTTIIASLGAQTLTLEPISVTALKTEQSLKETTSDVQIITSQELEEKHITTVLDALGTIANIPVTRNGGIGQQSSFFQRGFDSANTVVLIDGIRYNDPTTTKGQAQLENLMVNNIERIEILNGAQSGIWGANAVAGVINIITKKAGEKLSLGGSFEYGSFATTKIAADVSQKVGNLSYYVGANQIMSHSFSAMTPQGENPENFEKDHYKNQTLNTKLGYDLTASDTLEARFSLIDATSQYDSYDPITYQSDPNASGYETQTLNRLGSLTYRHQMNSDDYLSATYAVSTFDRQYPKDGFGYKGYNKELTLQGTYHYLNDDFIVAGVNTLNSKDTTSAQSLDSKGAFITNTNRFANFIFTQSLRYDDYDEFDNETTGKIGAKYFFTDDITFSTNYGTAYRTPSLDELYSPWGGNPDLKPEETKSFDATLSYKQLSFTYYNNLVDNLIQYDLFSWTNTQVDGKSRIKGYEVRYNDTFADVIALACSYNKFSAKNNDGDYLNRRPYDSALASITYYAMDTLSLGTSINYVGTRYDDMGQTNQTGRYTLVSAIANYAITPTLTAYLKGDNLTDKQYQEVTGYGTAGRSAYAGLSARF